MVSLLRRFWAFLTGPLDEETERLKSGDEEAVKWWSIR